MTKVKTNEERCIMDLLRMLKKLRGDTQTMERRLKMAALPENGNNDPGKYLKHLVPVRIILELTEPKSIATKLEAASTDRLKVVILKGIFDAITAASDEALTLHRGRKV